MGVSKSCRFAVLKAGILACTCLSVPAFAQDASSVKDNGAIVSIPDIIVTAQKREQKLQDVPAAVTALSPSDLTAVRFTGVNDLNALAPGLTVRMSPGGASAPTMTMRGVYGATGFGADSGIALYVDGVYVNNNIGANFDVPDLDRIEVLRGPQGTLFGRNSLGGAINLISRDPSGKLGIRQEVSVGSLSSFKWKTRLDLPSLGPIALSATYLKDQTDGDVRNLGAGTVWDFGPSTGGKIGKLVAPKTLGAHDIDTISVAAKVDFGQGIKAVYKYNHFRNEYTADAVGITGFSPNVALGFLQVTLQSIYAANNPALMTPISSKRPDAVNNDFNLPTVMTGDSHILTFSAPVTDTISIKNIAAYRVSHLIAYNEVDGLGGLIYTGPTYTGFGGTIVNGQPLLGIVSVTQNTDKIWSDEFQVNVKTHLFDLTAGLLHFHSNTVQGAVPGIANASYLASAVNHVIPARPGSLPSDVDVLSQAAYAQLEGHVTPKLDVVLGGRITHDRKRGTDNGPTPFLSIPIRYSNTTPTYLIGINYHVNDDILIYAKYSTAYISGGELDGVAFKKSSARSFEAGIKSELFDRKLRFNLTAFTASYKDVQLLISPTNLACQALHASIFGAICIINGGDARAQGIELETTLVPVQGLSLNANIGYTDYKVKNLLPSLRDPVDGNFFGNYRPKLTAQLSAGYEGRPIMGGAHLTMRADANYTSSQYPFPNGSNAEFALSKVPATWLVNGHIGFAGIDMVGGKGELTLWAKNLFNDRSIAYASLLTAAADTLAVQYNRARTVGVDFNIQF